MFFNKHIGMIIGAKYNWKLNPFYSIINAFLIIFLFALCFTAVYKYKKEKYICFSVIAVFILVFCSLVYSFIKVPSHSLERKQYYFDGNEQFTIGREKNVILFVADAVDNSLINEILVCEPEFFDFFNDFTLYTNTCSVYDFTAPSTAQMLFGYTQKPGTARTRVFLDRFKDNNYRILFYNPDIFLSVPDTPDEYVANYKYVNPNKEIINIDYKYIRKEVCKIVLLEMLPCVLKGCVGNVDNKFDYCIAYESRINSVIYENNEFSQNNHLSYNPYSDYIFMYQHILGTHYPCDDEYYPKTKQSLNIIKDYINQLKELGVYDDSLIILCSDHGLHDDVEGVPYPTASTPFLMIKKPGEHGTEITISNKPVYHMDLQATIIKYSGLSEDNDLELFGKSIDDFDENCIRTRVWFDSRFGSEIRKYTYTGDTDELNRVVKEDIYQKVHSYEFDYSEIED